MYKINALIVEDNSVSRRIIKEAIKLYNETPLGKEYAIQLLGECQSYIETITFLTVNPQIRLVFLDIELKNSREKNGLDIFKEYSDLSYLMITKNADAASYILSETIRRPDKYIKKIAEGNFNIPIVVQKITEYVTEEKSKFVSRKIKLKDIVIDIDSVSLISTSKVKIIPSKKVIGFKLETDTETIGRDQRHFNYCYAEYNQSSNENFLKSDFFTDSATEYSIKNIIATMNLDVNVFYRITQSFILNINHLVDFDYGEKVITVNVKHFYDSRRDEFKTMPVMIDIKESLYASTALFDILLTQRNRRFAD